MREIKFRLWEHGTMYDSDCCDFSIELCGYGNFNGILMQYTGLKDKNGKEIYEGDICSMKSFDTYVKGEVRYQPPEFCLRTANDYWELDYGDPAYIEIKIIGNIYENPELL